MRGRNQRKMIVYGLAIALLVTTVAYAVLQTTLNINGTVNRKGGSWNIHFENVANVVKGGDATITTPTISNAGANLTFQASLVVPRDSISFTVNVVNDGTIDAMLSQVVLSGQSEAAANDVTYTVTYADGTSIRVNDELKAGQTKMLKISAVYNEVENVSATAAKLDLGLTLIYVQADGTGSGELENPPYGPEAGDTSLANAPDLYNNSLTPIVYDEITRTWKVANTNYAWYNYSEQQWANAVILNSGVTKNAGDIVNIETEVKATYVWIPRYEYRIVGQYGTHTNGTAGTAEAPGEIEVNFIPYTQTTATSGYHIHPAFTFGNTQESGIWVGKFETTGSTTTPTILPNNIALTAGNVSEKFATSQKFATYLSNSSGVDAHMMKNSEWGAVAYLSQSEYGKYGNPDYTGAYKEVYPNDSTKYTGRSYGGLGINYNWESYVTQAGTYTYDSDYATSDSSVPFAAGLGASTTGTIYGVYDMSGGRMEMVMGLYYDEDHPGHDQTLESSGSEFPEYENTSGFEADWFRTESNKKYYDKLDYSNSYGQAIAEIQWWYGDYSMGDASSVWLTRSRGYNNPGIFAYGHTSGDGSRSLEPVGSRSVLARS